MAKRNGSDFVFQLEEAASIMSDFLTEMDKGKHKYHKELAGKLRLIYCKKSGEKSLLDKVLSSFGVQFYVNVNINIVENMVSRNPILMLNNSALSWLSGAGELVPIFDAVDSPDFKISERVFSYKEIFEYLADTTVYHVDDEIDDDHAFLQSNYLILMNLTLAERTIYDISKITLEIAKIIINYTRFGTESKFIKDLKNVNKSDKSRIQKIKEGIVPYHYLNSGRYHKAISWFDTLSASSKNPGGDQRRLAAWAYTMLGNQEKEKVTRIAPRSQEEVVREWSKVKEYYTKATKIDPSLWEAHYNATNASVFEANSMCKFDIGRANDVWECANAALLKLSIEHKDVQYIFLMMAKSFAMQAKANFKRDLSFSRDLWQQAKDKFQHASEKGKLQPQLLIDWASALCAEASGINSINAVEAKNLWNQAREILLEAAAGSSDPNEALNLLGLTFNEEASATRNSNPAHSLSMWKKAGEKYEEIVTIDPGYWRAFNNWGVALENEAKAIFSQSCGVDVERSIARISKAFQNYNRALNLKNGSKLILINMGKLFFTKAEILMASNADEAMKCLDLAECYFDKSKNEKNKASEVYYRLANTYSLKAIVQAKISIQSSELLWKKADSYYDVSLKLNPKTIDACNYWGMSHIKRADIFLTSDAHRARNSFSSASDKFQLSLEIDPENLDALISMAGSCSEEAKIAEEEGDFSVAKALWKKSIAATEKALILASDHFYVYRRYGLTCLEQSRNKNNEDKKNLLKKAETMFLKSEEILSGSSSYDIACVFSHFEDTDSTIYWLNKAAELKMLPPRSHIETDRDLCHARANPKFIEWFNKNFNY